MTKTPDFLKKGDLVGILSPAGIVKPSNIDPAIQLISDWGLRIVKGNHLYKQHNFFAGTDEQRLEDFQTMLDNPEIRAIFCSRGGYGIIKLIDKLNFGNFLQSPKWIIGYSDITIFHIIINQQLKCKSLHGLMPNNFRYLEPDNISLTSLKNLLFGESMEYSVEYDKLNKSGRASGELIGGNLSIIYSLQGTNYELDTTNKILFIEDTNEDIYHIDRMMMNLKLSGKLKSMNGLMVGGMSKIKDTQPGYGKTANEVVLEMVNEYDYPVIFGFQAGHMYPNLALYMGHQIEMHVHENGAGIKFI